MEASGKKVWRDLTVRPNSCNALRRPADELWTAHLLSEERDEIRSGASNKAAG